MSKNDEGGEEQAAETLSLEEANALVEQHAGWAESIARSVARAWNLDWQQDGLDGAAMEALIFCSRRFSPDRGVPFRGYARRRIHEASTEAARKSKGWVKQESIAQQERLAREVSVELFHLFPELRSGQLPSTLDEGSGEQATRASIRQLLIGATLLTTRQGLASLDPDDLLDCKNTIMMLCKLEPVHQEILWRIYWESDSMRAIAASWDTDELNVIREHQALLSFLQKAVGQSKPTPPPRVRPGLKTIALKLKRDGVVGAFAQYSKNIRE